MYEIPFLRPKLVEKEAYADYFRQIDDSRIYTNYGTLNTLFEQRLLHELFRNKGSAVTVNNATTGLMLAISLTKRRGKYALMPSFTFAATPLAAMWCGLEPYFIDIRPNDWCMDEELLKHELDKLGDEVAVVVPYAAFGTNMDISGYQSLQERGIPVVIDAAASVGSTLDGHFGQGFEGTVVFSFHATKGFGIGEGGLIYSADRPVIDALRQMANFGFDVERDSRQIGLNGKLSEYAAAIGLATLQAYEQKKGRRERVYGWYMEELAEAGLPDQGWTLQDVRGTVAQSFFSMLCPAASCNLDVVRMLAAHGIQSRTYFAPSCHQQTLFQSCPSTSMTVTEQIGSRIVNLPLWEDMNRSQVSKVVRCLRHG
ncbi:aminotransferase class I/II-fold pyridoxal phosphate-dependent enzyme [Paenibacillus piri]|uniref:Aminotransferase class I/II-fold pyridoxal phosphate-dependent enzyme n=1 Tax=Paenibacillus piri TaxID=2547395 RepID=A0A4R5KB28_9BACL|nr:aminotransferase class I/II-fold pyridoxal phosphate-dependent enzyme [Paenibacillus piri]TDF92341.1 aminotransferase class I/II-fold pyridoxal phosphate-dependent enzyme [Paenibacillus piri]